MTEGETITPPISLQHHRRAPFLILVFLLVGVALSPQGASSDAWKQVSTPHLTFIYREKDREAVKRLLAIGEQVYAKVTRFLGSSPSSVHIIVNGDHDSANGFYAPFPDRLTLLTAPSLSPALGASVSSHWLEMLLTHELVHYIQFTYKGGLGPFLRMLFGPSGRSSLNSTFTPGWATEGTAIFVESLLTEGGRGRNPFFEVLYKAPIVENNLFSLNQANYNLPGPFAQRIYVGGYILIDYLARTYGNDVIAKIIAKYTQHYSFALAVHSVTGKWQREIYADMKASLRKRYERERSLPLTPALTARDQDWSLPIATDRGWYAHRKGTTQKGAIVHLRSLPGQERIILSTSLSDPHSLAASSDGRLLLFASRAGPTSDLFSLHLPDGRPNRLTRGASLIQPTLDSTGGTLVAVQILPERSMTRLVRVDQDTGTITPLFEKQDATIVHPTLSPSGNTLVFSMKSEDLHYHLYLLTLNEKGAQPLLLTGPQTTGEYHPRFIDEESLSFISAEDKSLKLYRLSLRDKKFHWLAEDRVGILEATVNGDEVLYRTYGHYRYQIKRTTTSPQEVASLKRGTLTPADSLALPEIARTKPYSPILRLHTWVPYLNLKFFNFHIEPHTLNIGVLVRGTDYTKKSALTLSVGVYPYYKQLAGQFHLAHTLGPPLLALGLPLSMRNSTFSLTLKQSYDRLPLPDNHPSRKSNFWNQTSSATTSLQHSQYYATLNTFATLSARLDLTYAFTLKSLKPFSPFSSAPHVIPFHRLTSRETLSFLLTLPSHNKPPFASHSPPLFSLSFISEQHLRFVRAQQIPSFVFQGKTSVGIPLPYVQTLEPAITLTWQNTLLSSLETVHLSLHSFLRYHAPIAILDWGFPPLLSVRRLGVELALEHVLDFALQKGHLTGETLSSLSIQGSLTIEVGFNRYSGIHLKPFFSYRIFTQNKRKRLPFSFGLTFHGFPSALTASPKHSSPHHSVEWL